jgi:gliding motility-associated-like protein
MNAFGCIDTAGHTVHIWPEFRFWVPDCFTPNHDNLNDVFLPIVIGVLKYEMYVYNRWGELLFHTENTKAGWDGQFKGVLCKEDVYVWMIQFTNVVTEREEVHYGSVLLLK